MTLPTHLTGWELETLAEALRLYKETLLPSLRTNQASVKLAFEACLYDLYPGYPKDVALTAIIEQWTNPSEADTVIRQMEDSLRRLADERDETIKALNAVRFAEREQKDNVISALRKAISDTRNHRDKLAEEFNNLREDNDQFRKEIDRLRDENTRFQQDNAKLQQEKQYSEQVISEQKEMLVDLNSDKKRLNDAVISLSQVNKALEADRDRYRKQLQDFDY